MRLVIALIPVLALACGGGSRSAPPPTAPLPPEEGAAAETPPAEGTGEAGSEGGAAAAKPTAEVCPAPPDDGKPLPPATQAEIDSMSERGIALMEKMAGVFEANAEDCAKLTASLRDFISTNCAELNDFRLFAKRTTKQQQDQFNAKNGDKMMAIGMKMMPAVQKCQDDPALADLMGQMQ